MLNCGECLASSHCWWVAVEIHLSMESCWHWGTGAILKCLLYHHHLILLSCAFCCLVSLEVLFSTGSCWHLGSLTNTASHCSVPLCCFWVGLEFSFPAGSQWQYHLGRVPADAFSHCLVLPLCWWWRWKSSFPLSPGDTRWYGGVFHLVFNWSREYYRKVFYTTGPLSSQFFG